MAAFMRAANAIYDVPEGRPLWKTLPIRIAITALTGVLLAASALTVIFTGKLAHWTGDLLGLSPARSRSSTSSSGRSWSSPWRCCSTCSTGRRRTRGRAAGGGSRRA
ncbi:YhjD/YihY/BrkB family envelope integrity protein [Luedemannella flava]